MGKKQKVLAVIVLNLLIVALEVFYGLIANSVSLIADAVHNLGDVLAVIVTLIALILGARSASERMTFGFVRAEMMAGFVNSLFLLVSMAYILYESVERLLHPEDVASEYMIVVAAVALVANGISALILHKIGGEFAHAHHHHEHGDHRDDHNTKHGHHHHDLNIRSAYLHMLSDTLISLGVVIGGIAIYFFDLSMIDAVLSILFSLYILKETVAILRHTFLSLMDINQDDLSDIQAILLGPESIHSIHDLHLHRPSSKTMYLSAHLVFDENLSLAQIETILLDLRKALGRLGVTHSVLQPETVEMAQENILCAEHG